MSPENLLVLKRAIATNAVVRMQEIAHGAEFRHLTKTCEAIKKVSAGPNAKILPPGCLPTYGVVLSLVLWINYGGNIALIDPEANQ